MRLMKNAVYPEMRFEKAAVLAAALIGLPPATALRSLSSVALSSEQAE